MDKTAIVLLDSDGVIRFWSEGAEAMFGHRGADVTGESMDVIIPEPLRDRHWAGWRQAWDRGQIREGLPPWASGHRRRQTTISCTGSAETAAVDATRRVPPLW
jgi:PAS domain-containing protein